MIPSSLLAGLAVLALSLIPPVRADSPESLRANITASASGEFFFKSVPAVFEMKEDRWFQTKEAFGVAYKVGQDGAFQETWQTSGWHTNHGYLSRDGRYFVRMGPWASNLDELAIAFYDQGKLLKEYAIKDLVNDSKVIEHSTSHLWWRPEIQSIPNGFPESGFTAFHLVTIDKVAYSFDAATGEILEQTLDNGAKSGREIQKEQKAETEREGKRLFDSSPLKAAYEEHFEISEMEKGWPPNGLSFESRECWSAHLTPKTPFAIPCLIEAAFPISDSSHQIEASLTPADLKDSFHAALAHPYVSEMRAREKVTELRLRPRGDRLHWNHPELKEWLTRVTGISPADSDFLRDWAYLILDCEPRAYRSFYLNIRTGELLYEDDAKSSELVRLDAQGRKLPVKTPLEK